jgi:hypothetical protein
MSLIRRGIEAISDWLQPNVLHLHGHRAQSVVLSVIEIVEIRYVALSDVNLSGLVNELMKLLIGEQH